MEVYFREAEQLSGNTRPPLSTSAFSRGSEDGASGDARRALTHRVRDLTSSEGVLMPCEE
jgi:hypothetical protein